MFQDYIKNKTSKKTSNNKISRLKHFFDYAMVTKNINFNPFDRLSLYKVDKNQTGKRNFIRSELEIIFSGNNKIEKEILDCLRFLLLTGIRIKEFSDLNETSFYKKNNFFYIKVKTAKQEADKTLYRDIPLHPLLKDLSSYGWIAEIKKYCGKNSDLPGKLSDKLNSSIDIVVNDKSVNVHRLRGNFANIIDEFVAKMRIVDYDVTKSLLGHEKDNDDDYFNHRITKTTMGDAPDMTRGTYAHSKYEDVILQSIKALDVFNDLFKYLDNDNLPSIIKKSKKHKKSTKKA